MTSKYQGNINDGDVKQFKKKLCLIKRKTFYMLYGNYALHCTYIPSYIVYLILIKVGGDVGFFCE